MAYGDVMVMGLGPTTGPLADSGLLSIADYVLDGMPILEVVGELDMVTAPAFDAALQRPLRGSSLTCDLRGVSFIDSTGMEVLMRARDVALREGCELIVLPSAVVRRLAGLLDLEDCLLGQLDGRG
jgi:anti-sigma B factor antagonist